MRTIIYAAGWLVIPNEVRRQAGLRPAMALDVRWQDGRIEIEPAPIPVTLTRKGRFVVAVPQVDGLPLNTREVEETRDAIAREHESGQ